MSDTLREMRDFLAVAALAVGCAGRPVSPASAPSPLLGKALPTVRGVTLEGRDFAASALGGHRVVIKFFADYCEPCKRTLPVAERLSREHPDVTFVGVSEDEYPSTARAVATRHGLTFTVLHDASHVLLGRFRVHELPVTFLSDPGGVIRWVGGPAQSDEDLGHAIDALR